jgi:hypothetical protein
MIGTLRQRLPNWEQRLLSPNIVKLFPEAIEKKLTKNKKC